MYDCLFQLTLPVWFVFGEDRVTCHTGAYVNPSEDGDA